MTFRDARQVSLCTVRKVTEIFYCLINKASGGHCYVLFRLYWSLVVGFDRKPIILPPYARRTFCSVLRTKRSRARAYIADHFSILKAFLSSSIFCHHADCHRVEILRLGDYVLLTRAYYASERGSIRGRIGASRSISRPRNAYELASRTISSLRQ